MPWYKSGTVSVALNSNAVLGTGTAFIANSRVGDAFRGPDGGWYEVTNIASDIAMSISPNYQGATNAAGVYALAPMQGYVKESADRLRALVNQFGSVLAILGETPTLAGIREALNLTNTDGLPEGITNKYLTSARVVASVLTGLDLATVGAVVATDTILSAMGKLQASKAAKGANSDITSLSGLTTALSIAQGGTGRNDGLAWGSLKGSLSLQSDLQAALDAKSTLGVGQTWQDMTANRGLGTTYINTSGKPIQVVVFATGASQPAVALGTVVGSTTAIFGNPAALAGGGLSSMAVIVPTGATYNVAVNTGSATVFRWMELR